MIDLKDKDCIELHEEIYKQGHYLYEKDGEVVVSDETIVQEIIDNFVVPLPNLSPRKFKYMLAATGIDDVVEELLLMIKDSNRAAYAQIKSQLEGASFYEWEKSKLLKNQLMPQLLTINPNLLLDDDNLKLIWMIAYSLD